MRPEAQVIELPGGEQTSSPSAGGKPAAKGGGGGRQKTQKPIDWGRYGELSAHFALIYGTDTVIDTRSRLIMKVNALRLAYGTDHVKLWLNSPERRMIVASQLVFSPSGGVGEDCINLFSGLAMQPVAGDCAPLLELLAHLCADSSRTDEGRAAVVDWVLNWLAYPLQHLGSKMASALVFHGGQGTGKNLFFEAIASIYGRYALVVGQDQLEDKFNDWASQKLFLIGDEVVARAELYHQKNKLKAFITSETIQINTKMLPLRTEMNHVNVVFLSNEQQPLALEPDDRRYFVVYTPPRRDDDLYDRVAACLANGGAEAFLAHLLGRDLSGFGPHTRPLMTRAKKDLIELGLRPAERFLEDWLKGFLPLPLQVCSSDQLYRAFVRWCRDAGERFPPSHIGFSKAVSKAARDRLHDKVIKLEEPDRGKVAVRMWIPDGCAPPNGTTAGKWAAEATVAFERALAEFFGRVEEGER